MPAKLGGVMKGYRAYVLGSDGRIIRREEYYSRTDREAIEKAKVFVKDCVVEVWSEDNVRLAVLEPEEK